MKEKAKQRRNMVSTSVTDEAYARLEKICYELDRTKSWVISRLILGADVDRLRGTSEGGSK